MMTIIHESKTESEAETQVNEEDENKSEQENANTVLTIDEVASSSAIPAAGFSGAPLPPISQAQTIQNVVTQRTAGGRWASLNKALKDKKEQKLLQASSDSKEGSSDIQPKQGLADIVGMMRKTPAKFQGATAGTVITGGGNIASLGAMVNLKVGMGKWKKKAALDPNNPRTFANDGQHLQLILNNEDECTSELPLSLKLEVFEEAYPIVTSVVKGYKNYIGSHHKLTVQATEKHDDLTRLYNNISKNT